MISNASTRYQSLAKLLPVEVPILKNYVMWIEELGEQIEKPSFLKADSVENYIKLILEESKSGKSVRFTDSDYNEDVDNYWRKSVGYFARNMTLAAMSTFVGDFEAAKTHLNISPASKESLNNLTGIRKDLFLYLWENLAWAVDMLLNGAEKNSQGRESASMLGEVPKVMTPEEGNQKIIEATLEFLKGCLSDAMHASASFTLAFWIKATELDPECNIWFQYAFVYKRRIRRSRTPGKTPDAEEERFARIAYELCPNDPVSIADLALFLKDSLWTKGESYWEQNQSDYLKCAELFGKALGIADKPENTRWFRKIKGNYAEFLALGKGKALDRDLGKRMLDELEHEFPRNSFILQKVGKLCHFGLYGVGLHKDLDRAKEIFRRACANDPGNYPCVMDFIKVLLSLKEYREIITLIDTALEHLKFDDQMARLHIAKGYTTWIWNPMNLNDPKSDAVESWVKALKHLPECANYEVYNSSPVKFVEGYQAHVIKFEIKVYLETMKHNCPKCMEVPLTLLIETFTEGVSKSWTRNNVQNSYGSEASPEIMSRLRTSARTIQNEGNWRNREESCEQGEIEKKESRCQRRRSEADEDNDWRRKK